jgi:hypothetical protein
MMIKSILLTVVLKLLLHCYGLAQTPDSVKLKMQPVYKVLAEMKKAQDAERWYEVIEIANESFAKDSATYLKYLSWDLIGYARFKTGDYQGAATDLARSIKQHTKRPWEIMHSAKIKVNAHLTLGQIKEAAQTYEDIDTAFPALNAAQEAAVLYLGAGCKKKFNQLINAALKQSIRNLDSVDINYNRASSLLDYAELLIIANKKSEATSLLEYSNTHYTQGQLALREYFLASIRILNGDKIFDLSKARVSEFMRNQFKVAKWDFTMFNRWMKYAKTESRKQEQLIALQDLIEDVNLYK